MRHVRRAALVDEHGDSGMLPDDGARGAGVIEMNVREKEVRDVGQPETLLLQTGFQRRQAGGGTWVHQRHRASTRDHTGRNRLWSAPKEQIHP